MLFALLTQTALAEPIPVTALKTAAKAVPVKVGIGGVFQGGGAFSQPSSLDGAGLAEAFSTLSPGYGVSFDVRVLGIVGVEIDAIHSRDSGRSPWVSEDDSGTVDLQRPSWHVPVVLKVGLPSPVVKPNLQLGAQLIVPTESIFSTGGADFSVGAASQPYLTWVAGAGVEVKLPLGKADIRLPIAYRASIDSPQSRAASERVLYALDAEGALDGVEMGSDWRFRGSVTAGLTYYWPK